MTDNVNVEEIKEESLEAGTVSEKDPDRIIVFEEALEAILFAAGHPISYATLARVFDLTPAAVKAKVCDYALKYNNPDIPRGVMLLTFAETCQLCTKQYYLPEIRDALGIRKSGTLSTSSMEALAIIAYNQPVTRVFVDTLRRVDSSYAMNNLLDRGLIESKGRLDAPGRPMLYGTTPDFLRCFGLGNLAELPKTSEELIEVFEKATSTDETAAPQIEMELTEQMPPESEPEETETTAVMEAEDEPSAEDDIINDI